ncbi:hypothetical protein A9Q81_06815 [Gammaproteobacteria bacterium 42_54_T18]|nr:hypothetical protein A9Q81_06815 [Gammaproteobacteria bacterium 42_54_T18]
MKKTVYTYLLACLSLMVFQSVFAEHKDVSPISSEVISVLSGKDNKQLINKISADIQRLHSQYAYLARRYNAGQIDKQSLNVGVATLRSELAQLKTSLLSKQDFSAYRGRPGKKLAAKLAQKLESLRAKASLISTNKTAAKANSNDQFIEPSSPPRKLELQKDIIGNPHNIYTMPMYMPVSPEEGSTDEPKGGDVSGAVNASEESALIIYAGKVFAALMNIMVADAVAEEVFAPTLSANTLSCYNNDVSPLASRASDLDLSTEDVEVNESIQEIAASLGFSAVNISNYVTNSIEFEHYAGLVKGAVGTFKDKAGNNFDHAALTVALLRLSNIPARFVLGDIALEDKPLHKNWWQVNTEDAMLNVVYQAGWKVISSNQNLNGRKSHRVAHVWVEACLPVAERQGAKAEEGYAWTPLDTSFKYSKKREGISVNTDFNYASFLSEKTRILAPAKYTSDVLAEIRSTTPNATVNDIGVRWEKVAQNQRYLPKTLPYKVIQKLSWQGETGPSEIASIPANWIPKVKLCFFEANAGFCDLDAGTEGVYEIPLTEFTKGRVTLSYRPVNASDKNTYDQFMSGETMLTCPEDSIALKPIIKINGVTQLAGSGQFNIDWSEINVCDQSNFKKYNLKMALYLDGKRTSALVVEFDGLLALEYYALQVYGHHGSDAYLNERNGELLSAVQTTQHPWDSPDETVGEFLNIVLTKYLRYVTDNNAYLGPFFNQTGRSGHHIGMTKTAAQVAYVYDLPYAIQSGSYAIDVPGGLSTSLDIDTGASGAKYQMLAGLGSSELETYVWQENAMMDAISTITGLQAASEAGNEVNTFTDSVSFSNWATSCLEMPSNISQLGWGQSTPLSTMVSMLRERGVFDDDWIRSFFVGNDSYFTSYSGLTSINNAISVEYGLCYSTSVMNSIKSKLDDTSFATTITAPKHPVEYKGWKGTLYMIQQVKGDPDNPSSIMSGFPIGPLSGGWAIPTPSPMVYNPPNISIPNSSSFSTGWDIDIGLSDYGINTPSFDAMINDAVNYGGGNFTTTYGDPVNMVTGNMYHEETDFRVAARGLPVNFKRTYNSRVGSDGPLGYGWNHSFQQDLAFKSSVNGTTPEYMVWTNSSGGEKRIKFSGAVQLVNGVLNLQESDAEIPDGFYFEASRPHASGVASEFVITEKTGIQYHFQAVNGVVGDVAKLTKIIDNNGNAILLSYVDSKLNTVIDPDNRVISFHYYAGTEHIQKIRFEWDGTEHFYYYNAKGNLQAYRNPEDADKNIDSTIYSYNSNTNYACVGEDCVDHDHEMASFEYANGYKMNFEYYANGKIFRHYNAKGESINFTYNGYRRESTTVNERGGTQQYVFNKDGLPLDITEADGTKSYKEYEDPNDPFLRTAAVDAMGYRTEYAYDTDGSLIKTTMPSGATVEYFHFNAQGKPQLIKNANGDYHLSLFDANGNLTDSISFKQGFGSTINPATFVPTANASQILSWSHNQYGANGILEETKRINNFANGTTGPYTTYDFFDDVNNVNGVSPVSVSYYGDIDGNGAITSNEGLGTYNSTYDSQNRLLTGFDGALYPVEYQYDKNGRLVKGSDGLGNMRDYNYDPSGLLESESLITIKDGKVVVADKTSRIFDDVARMTSITDASEATTNLEYDEAGNLVKVTSPDGYIVNFTYNAMNRQTHAYDEEGNVVERVLDDVGRLRKLIDPNGNETVYIYYGPSENGRVQRVTTPEGRWTEFFYSPAGQVTKVIDNAGKENLTNYDALGRTIRVVQPVYSDVLLGNVRPVISYHYNALGFQTAVWAGYTNVSADINADNLKLQVQYTYDDFGRVLTKINAIGKVWRVHEYDVHSNVLSSEDPEGNVTTSVYKQGGVLASQSTTGIHPVQLSFERNVLGQPEKIISSNVTYDYLYDAAHRVKKVTDSRAKKFVEYDYSLGGFLNSIEDSEGNKTVYSYDPTGRLTGIRGADNQLISYVYDAGGRVTQKVFPNDVVTTYKYFLDNRVKSIATDNLATTLRIAEYIYSYDNSGNAENVSQALNGVAENYTYGYDNLGRLTSVLDQDSATVIDQVAYDQFGNRIQRTVQGQTNFYEHNDLHQVESVRQGSANGAIIKSFLYDENGNLRQKVNSGSTQIYDYDAADRLVNVSGAGLQTEQYAYDQGNRRIQKTVGSDITNFHYSGPDIIAEYQNDWGTAAAVYSHGAGMDDPIMRKSANDSQYYHNDGLSSIVALTDKAGNTVATNRYGAWGKVTQFTGSTALYGFTGREPDASGLMYYRARYYDPDMGRFTQADPLGFVNGVNQYAYVLNSPVNYVDPWGTETKGPTSPGGSGGYQEISYYTGNPIGADGHKVNPDLLIGAAGLALAIATIEVSGPLYLAAEISLMVSTDTVGPIGTGRAAEGASDLIKVRHHTSTNSSRQIKESQSIRVARGDDVNPVGVNVEVAPFGSARTASADTGAFETGAYVEFAIPRSSVIPRKGYIGPRNNAIIPTPENKPLSLEGLNPKFKKSTSWF